MVLVQIALTNSTYTNYALNLSGIFKAKISHFSYMYSGVAGVHEILIMRSSKFTFSNSTNNGFMFTNQSSHVQYNGESPEFILQLDNWIDLTITNAITGGAPTNFSGAVLTLDLEPILEPQNKEPKFNIQFNNH